MSGNRRKAFLVSAALLSGTMLMTACQNGDADATQSPSSGTPAPSTAAPSGSSGSGGAQSGGKNTGGQGSTAGTGSGGNSKAAKCRTSELEFTAKDRTISGDANGTVVVELKNHGGHACAISGYAGVDLKTNAGTVSAKRTGEPAPATTLKVGQSIDFGITYPINKTGGSGVRITGLLVTPPSETKTVTLTWPGGATLPAEDGSSPVKVGPIGSAGQGGGN
ncbi:DUF4232 domain-containing protein [Streptomyces sp. SDr-06]|uniref:DUF4232 domain-containing protein n=1 Tax=Streptomyces sp. SDr-06 TaxID=2267702 RepID=UPI000DEA6F37|nr:DUF4232 domain-containing protein [Streptomyces sp. SDr-06]RCH67475.1 DUF4232 domain-containing protein [Streptomyces sp. SDr-06]